MKKALLSALLAFVFIIAVGQTRDIRLWGGTTSDDRFIGLGSIYSLNADGTDFQTIKTFEPNPDGGVPLGQVLKLSDGTFMGTTSEGGLYDMGVIYKLDADATGYTKVMDFAPGLGFNPSAKLIQDENGIVYGTARSWIDGFPTNPGGHIFRINPDGSEYKVLYALDYPLDGFVPWGGLLKASDGKLYGTTMFGGSSGATSGVVYKLNTDGTGFQKIHVFDIATDGTNPVCDLMEGTDGFLYGYTSTTLFKLKKDGTSFQVIHTFGLAGDGGQCGGIIQLQNGKVLGVANGRGGSAGGVLFNVETDGTDYSIIHEFTSMGWPGPIGLTQSGKVYVPREDGIHLVTVDGSGSEVLSLHEYDNEGLYRNVLEISDGIFVGVVDEASVSKNGAIFKLTAAGVLTEIKNFPQEGADLATTMTLASNGYLYGKTLRGGQYGYGIMFRLKPNGTDYTKLYDFLAPSVPLYYSGFTTAPLLEIDGQLFSKDAEGVYRIDLSGAVFEYIHTEFLNSQTGQLEVPNGSLAYGPDGYIYGLTKTRNLIDDGMIYKMLPDGSNFQIILNLSASSATTGYGPIDFALLNNELFVHTYSSDEDQYKGKFFKVGLDGSNPTVLLDDLDYLANALSSQSHAIMMKDGRVYGASSTYLKPFYSMNPDGSDFTYHTVATYSGEPTGTPLELDPGDPGTLYGATVSGNGIYSYNIGSGIWTTLYHEAEFWPMTGLLAFYKLEQSIDIPDFGVKYANEDPFDLPELSSADLPVSYASSNPNVAVIEGHTVIIVGKGSTIITATQAGDMATKPASAEKELVILGVPQTIEFAELADKRISDPDFDLTASATSGLDVRYTSGNTDVVTIFGSTVHLVGVGTVTITAYQDGSNIYAEATPVERILTINKGIQEITFTPFGEVELVWEMFVATATASSDLPVVYSSPSDKIGIAGDVISLLSPGRATLVASQPGDDNWEPAEPEELSFCIKPAPPEVAVTVAASATLTSSNPEGNQWYEDGEIIPGATDQTYITNKPGDYTVITTIDDCVSVASNVVHLTITGVGESIENKLLVYPNPVSADLHVQLADEVNHPIVFQITDVLGRIVYSRQTTTRALERFDFSDVVPGTYIIRANVNGKDYIKRIVRN